jgi:cytochrome c
MLHSVARTAACPHAMSRPDSILGMEFDMKTTVTTAALALAFALTSFTGAAFAQQGNADAGEDVFKKCRACHAVGDGATNKVGPQLNGIIGRKSGTVEGFAYSDSNKEAGAKGLVWTPEELIKYLENPQAYMPKNKMAFAGLKDEQDRRDVIAYLAKFK